MALAQEKTDGQLDLLHASISDLRAVLGKRLSAVHLVDVCLERIAQVNPVLHAVIAIDPTARQQAERCDRAFKDGINLGLLHAVPVLIKDHIDVKGLPTTHGSHALATAMPLADAKLVQKLKETGAIILGKSNESEWGYGRDAAKQLSGWSGIGGQAICPLFPKGDPIGSSSGSAIAVAIGLVPMAIGSELWGSITCPSMANALSTMKPSFGAISREGSIAADVSQVTYGPMTKYVEDSAICMQVLAGKDANDTATLDQPETFFQVSPKFTPDALKGVRLGIIRNDSPKIGMGDAPESVRVTVLEAYTKAIEVLKSLGAVTIDVEIDGADIKQGFDTMFSRIVATDVRLDFERWCKTVEGTKIQSIQDAVDFNLANPELEMPPGREGQSELVDAAESGPRDAQYFKDLAAFQEMNRKALQDPMDKNSLDALVSLTTTFERYSAWAGLPEAVTPIGFLPAETIPVKRANFEHYDWATFDYHPNKCISLSFIGRRWDDAKVLEYTCAFEKRMQMRTHTKFFDAATPKTQPQFDLD